METEGESRHRLWNELADEIASGSRSRALQLLHELKPRAVPLPAHVLRRVEDRAAQPPSLVR